MAFESVGHTAGGHAAIMPKQIAHNPSLTAREKLELLGRLKAEVTGALQNSEDLGLAPSEIDAAMQEVRFDVQNGIGEETIVQEDR